MQSNKALHLTAYSVRSSIAPDSGRSGRPGLALQDGSGARTSYEQAGRAREGATTDTGPSGNFKQRPGAAACSLEVRARRTASALERARPPLPSGGAEAPRRMRAAPEHAP